MFKKTERKPTKLIMEAIEAGRMDEVFELMDVERAEEFKQWVKGYLAGYGSVITGIAIVAIIDRVIKKRGKQTEG